MPKCICGHVEVDHVFYKEACVFKDNCYCYRYEPTESNTEEVVDENDWTTARVVRDRDGRLWGRDATTFDSFARRWVLVGSDRESDGCYEESMVRRYGPLVPVLDADGLPVVRTVGDLTARNVGRTVTVEGYTGELYEVLHRRGMTAIVMSDENDHDLAGPAWFPASGIDTPCELLPEGDTQS